jgi:hypothetical protein
MLNIKEEKGNENLGIKKNLKKRKCKKHPAVFLVATTQPKSPFGIFFVD